MKILEKRSCYVTVLHKDADDFTKPEFFSQFGDVKSVRVLKGNEPTEVYVRFTDERAAARAIAWCNARPSRYSAKHGFSRYCFKFLNNKPCKNKNCENRHSWAESQDVLTFGDNRWKDHSVASAPRAQLPEREREQKDEVGSWQQQIAVQGCIIDDLMREITQLQSDNSVLRSDIAQLNYHQTAVDDARDNFYF